MDRTARSTSALVMNPEGALEEVAVAFGEGWVRVWGVFGTRVMREGKDARRKARGARGTGGTSASRLWEMTMAAEGRAQGTSGAGESL